MYIKVFVCAASVPSVFHMVVSVHTSESQIYVKTHTHNIIHLCKYMHGSQEI